MHSTYKAVIADSEARMDQLSQVGIWSALLSRTCHAQRCSCGACRLSTPPPYPCFMVDGGGVCFAALWMSWNPGDQEVVTLKDTIRQLTLAQSFAKAGAGSSASSVTSPSPASSTPGRRQRSSSINATAVPFVRGGVEVAPTAVGGIIIRKLANPVPKT
jgi:hypothetical protein